MNKTHTTYRLGSIVHRAPTSGGRNQGCTRPLYRDDDTLCGYVCSDAGPAVVGSLTHAEATDRWGCPEAMRSYTERRADPVTGRGICSCCAEVQS